MHYKVTGGVTTCDVGQMEEIFARRGLAFEDHAFTYNHELGCWELFVFTPAVRSLGIKVAYCPDGAQWEEV